MNAPDKINHKYHTLSISDTHQSMYHVTVLSNFARGYDKYSRTYSKSNIPESTFSTKFHLLGLDELHIGIDKNLKLLDKLSLPNNELVVLETRVKKEDLIVTDHTKLGHYIRQDHIHIHRLHLVQNKVDLIEFSAEELAARSLVILQPKLLPYSDLKPRSISILPIAIGCQAKCSFCFSNYSVSSDQDKGTLNLNLIQNMMHNAKHRGAKRAVITGGGEPTLYPKEQLLELIRTASTTFPQKVVLITNGYILTQMSNQDRLSYLSELQAAGLTTLAVSHHHWNTQANAGIMNLDIDVSSIAETLTRHPKLFPKLSMRLICVLQKYGIEDSQSIEQYIQWAVSFNISEICFKELYVSSSVDSEYYSKPANEWSQQHQVPLSVLMDHLEATNWKQVEALPWGAPVYQNLIHGQSMKVAAYTEPSLLWERSNGICRSWNIMADGRCLTSLEDRNSEISCT